MSINKIKLRGGVAEWVVRLTRIVEVVGSASSKALVVSLSKKRYPYCLVLVGSRNGLDSSVISQ